MALILPNLDRITKEAPQLGEALTKAQTFINQNVVVVGGTRKAAPTKFVNPTRIPG
jgi:hypothetical protein